MQAQIYPGRQDPPDWNNPGLTQINRMQAHAYRIPFPDMASCRHAASGNRLLLSPYIISLDGPWDFRFYPNILHLPENILSFRSGFERRTVPDKSSGLGDRLYSQPNQDQFIAAGEVGDAGETWNAGKARACRGSSLPFPVMPPYVPHEQPVLVYRRTCHMPGLWSGLRKHLVLQGIRSAVHVFVNGRPVGFSSGSGLPAEFDLTQHLHDGDNELFLLVYPLSTGSYFEQNTCVCAPGIMHGVYLEAVPAISLRDCQIRTVWLPEQLRWRLDIRLTILSSRISLDQPQANISLRLDDQVIQEKKWRISLTPADPANYHPPVQTVGILDASLELADILPWCDEIPNLYDLYLSIEDRNGRDLVSIHQSVGFRQIAWHDGEISVNGRRIQLCAVSWREKDEPAWSGSNLAPVIRLFTLFKKNRLNTIYFRDVPPDPILLDLCSILGFYVIEDAPLDPLDPEWLTQWPGQVPDVPLEIAWDRLERLMSRDRNQACVLAWSAALLAQARQDGQPPWLGRLVDRVYRLDPTRPIHGCDLPDIAEELDRWMQSGQQDQPADLAWLVQPGSDQADARRIESLRLSGRLDRHRCYYSLNQPLSLLSGLGSLFPPVWFQPSDLAGGRFFVQNRMSWTDLSDYQINWQLLSHGMPVQDGIIEPEPTEPGGSLTLELDYGQLDVDSGELYASHDYLVRFDLIRIIPTWVEKADEILYSQEFHLFDAVSLDGIQSAGSGGGRIRLESDRHHLIVSGPRFWLVFNRLTGMLESWRAGDKELIAAAPGLPADLPAFQPIPGSGLQCTLKRRAESLDQPDLRYWHKLGFERQWTQILSTHEGCDGQMAVIEFSGKLGAAGLAPCCSLHLRYEIRKNGELHVFSSLSSLVGQKSLSIPCFSMLVTLRRNYSHVSWQGTGPGRSMVRLPLRARYGVYDHDLADLVQLPLDEGVWKDVRWLTLKDDSGFGLHIHSESPFAFDLMPADSVSGAAWQPLAAAGQMPVVQIFHPEAIRTCRLDEPLKMSFILRPVVSGDRMI